MHLDLTNKKQRKQFWKDCEKAAATCGCMDGVVYSWDELKKLSPSDTFSFWGDNDVLWADTNFVNNLSNNAHDTFSYYGEHGVDDLDRYIE